MKLKMSSAGTGFCCCWHPSEARACDNILMLFHKIIKYDASVDIAPPYLKMARLSDQRTSGSRKFILGRSFM